MWPHELPSSTLLSREKHWVTLNAVTPPPLNVRGTSSEFIWAFVSAPPQNSQQCAAISSWERSGWSQQANQKSPEVNPLYPQFCFSLCWKICSALKKEKENSNKRTSKGPSEIHLNYPDFIIQRASGKKKISWPPGSNRMCDYVTKISCAFNSLLIWIPTIEFAFSANHSCQR